MAIQRLKCARGGEVWQRESRRGRAPRSCPSADCPGRNGEVMSISIDNPVSAETGNGPAISGEALAIRVMENLAARGMLLSQNRDGKAYESRY